MTRPFMHLHPKLLAQLHALIFKCLNNLDLAGGHAALDQAADDGACHVAAANKSDVLVLAGECWCHVPGFFNLNVLMLALHARTEP